MTLTALAVAAFIAVIALWQARRARPFGSVALVPWNGLLFVALVALIVLTVHWLALRGFHVAR